jgi:hypothetical protein
VRRPVVRVGYFHKHKRSAIVSRTAVDAFDSEPMNLGNNRFGDSGAMLYELGEILYDVRLVSDFK